MRVVLVILFAVQPLLIDSQILPTDTKPIAYSLTIPDLDLTKATFNGTVKINMTVVSPTPRLLLHAHNLTVSGVSVMRKSSFSGWVDEPISGFSTDNSLLTIDFPQYMAATNYIVSVFYQGYFKDTMEGFAKVEYYYNRIPKYLGVTSLEPTYARSVFPCYDVIGFRTRFVMDITVDASYVVLSNVAPSYINDTDPMKRTFHFNSPAIPVSKLALVVLSLETYKLGVDNTTGTVIYTRAPYPYSNHTVWSSQVTAHLLAKLGEYTHQNYESEVLEQVLIPEFTTDSSEAWGLSTYPEEAFLVTPGTTSTRDTQDVALGLSSGLAQHWFGGLVSMNSWEHQWLIRGFPEYLKYIIAASLPEMSSWELKDQMVVEMVQPALALDITSQHALAVDTQGDLGKIQSIYDDLTKFKGGALIRMLQDVLGDGLFIRALRVYLQNSAKSTSEPNELWNIMYEAARESHVDLGRQSVEGIMDNWVNTPGCPILNVTWNGTHFNISQPQTSPWYVPVSFTMQTTPNVVNKTWLEPGGSLPIKADSPQWIILNINHTGYYRVHYQEPIMGMLRNQLAAEPNKLPRLSRAQMIDDVFCLTRKGLLSPVYPLQFTNYLKTDYDYYSWHSALRNYQELLHSLYGHSAYELLQKHILDLMEKVVNVVGLISRPEDSHIDKLMRVMVLEKACAYEHPVCVQKAVTLLRSWMATSFYDKDLTSGLLCAAMANSSTVVWQSVWSMYHYSVVPSVKANILRALPCSRDVILLNQFLGNVTSASAPVLNSKEKTIVLQTLASTPFGADLLLDWLIQTLRSQTNSSGSNTSVMHQTENPSHAEKQSNLSSSDSPADQQTPPRVQRGAASSYNLSEDDVKAILSYIVPKLTTLEQGAKIDGFVATNNTGLSTPTLELMRNATRQIYQQADWAHKHNAPITSWLEQEASSSTPVAPTDKPTAQPPTSAPPKPSGAPQTHSGVTLSVGLLAFVLHYIVTS